MTTQDLWPADILSGDPSVREVLEEQGKALSALTGGKLVGEVSRSDNGYALDGHSLHFNVYCPSANFRFALFCISQKGSGFPVTFHVGDETVSAVNYDHFIDILKEILHSHRTREAVRRIMVHAQGGEE